MSLRDALTPTKRRAIYQAVAALLALLVAYGVLSEGQVAVWLEVVGATLGLLASLLAGANTPSTDASAEDYAEVGEAPPVDVDNTTPGGATSAGWRQD